MPYIAQPRRIDLASRLHPLIETLKRSPPEKLDGDLNYCITMMLKMLYGESYFELNRALGVLEAAKLEFYRRRVVPYEALKAVENGDVF